MWHDDGLRQWRVVDVGMDADELDGVAGACDDAPEKGAVARHAFVADGVFDEDDVAVVGFGVGKCAFVEEEGVDGGAAWGVFVVEVGAAWEEGCGADLGQDHGDDEDDDEENGECDVFDDADE